MPRYEFNPGNGFVPAASYRLDTASGSTSPATIEYLFTEGAVIPGSTLAADMQGALPDFAAPVATLYAKQLTPAGTVTGSPITLAARQPELGLQPAPGGGAVSSVVGLTGAVTGAQIAADPAVSATYGRLAGANAWTGAQDFSGATVTGIAGGGGSGTVGSVADITALRAVAISGAVPQIVRSTGALYAPSGSSTDLDDGLRIIQPNTGSGRWLLVSEPSRVLPFGMGMSRLTKARTGVFRVMQFGTSISNFDNSPNQIFIDRLKALYGDAGEQWIHAGALGGSYESSFQGWKKQPYGGPLYIRSRGESTSSDLVFSGHFDRLTVEVSKDAGGATCDVQIDGVTVGTLDSSGAQQYGVSQTFSATLGYHTVRVVKPSAGFVFLERLKLWTSTAVGVETLDTTLGGSSLRNTSTLRIIGADSAAGIAVSGTNGVDAHFGRTDVDLFVVSHLVNDMWDSSWYPTNWQAAVDRAIALTAATQTPIVWIIEMGGHNIMPNDAGTTRNNIQLQGMRAYLLEAAKKNAHFYALDWHGMTAISDIAVYQQTYYPLVTGLNIPAGTYTGDFIHPNTLGQIVGTQALFGAFGLEPSAYDSKIASQGDRYVATGTAVPGSAVVLGETRTYPTASQRGRSVLVGGKGSGVNVQPLTAPLYVDDAITDYDSTINTEVAASVTSDSTGKYVDYSNAAKNMFGNIDPGERVTVTFLASGNISLRPNTNGQIFLAGTNGASVVATAGTTIFYSATKPTYLTIEFSSSTNNDWLALTGRFYAAWVTRSNGAPLITSRKFNSLRRVGPPSILVGDPVFDPTELGQQFVEDVFGPAQVFKKKIGSCWKWDASTQAWYLAGLYECMDRTLAGYRLARIDNGTVTYPTNALAGGNAEATTGSARIALSSVSIATAGTMTLTWRPLVAGTIGWQLSFFNGGNNQSRWLTPDGTWGATTATSVFTTGRDRTGEPIAVSFALPTDTATLGTTPQLRLTPTAGLTALSTGVLVKGSSAVV